MEAVEMLKRGNVVRNKETGQKRVLRRDEPAKDSEEKVCDIPHEDGDMSYLCGAEWCGCCQ